MFDPDDEAAANPFRTQHIKFTNELTGNLNQHLMDQGTELIEHAAALKQHDRDPETQATVAKFVNHVMNKALNDQRTTTGLAVEALHQRRDPTVTPTVAATPEEANRRFWRRLGVR